MSRNLLALVGLLSLLFSLSLMVGCGDDDGDSSSDGDADGDADGDTDSDTDADGDSDSDTDTDTDADGDTDGDADGDADGDTDTDTDTDADLVCADCHDPLPPGGQPHTNAHSDYSCNDVDCHGDVVNEDGTVITNPDLHMDGQSDASCDNCH